MQYSSLTPPIDLINRRHSSPTILSIHEEESSKNPDKSINVSKKRTSSVSCRNNQNIMHSTKGTHYQYGISSNSSYNTPLLFSGPSQSRPIDSHLLYPTNMFEIREPKPNTTITASPNTQSVIKLTAPPKNRKEMKQSKLLKAKM